MRYLSSRPSINNRMQEILVNFGFQPPLPKSAELGRYA